MPDQTLPTGPVRNFALLLQKWGGMAKYRHRPRLAGLFFRAALVFAPTLPLARRELAKARPRSAGGVPHLNSVGIGTTGTCNASCVHCPTGKASTAASPRGTIPMDLFRKIIDGIVDEGVAVDSHIGFGLFGDGLVDPLVVERARYVHERLPDVIFSVNTNGAAYNSARHKVLYPYVTLLSLHCESLTPETYNYLMTPLRAKNVFPKYEQILRDFPGKVRVSVPVSRANRDELVMIREWFMSRGAREVVFDPMASRCMEDRSLFDKLSLAPVRIRCDAEVARDLIVDCDGAVLTCCQDFVREHPLGNLTVETFRETLTNLARNSFAQKMTDGRHDEISTCSRCYGDVRTPQFPFDHPVLMEAR
ncbi:radical SAM/SPASM domain-containing protein [Sphingomonas crusticola]|uniref:radical SAM/SPASM domain-containing protein n=1 Tax=Sphingomonas crusticola TaxID=1697973 RepID=UPI0013C31F4B|nr:radical SAM/SPASM domain-containing protein [Sphingomonas crusticola]